MRALELLVACGLLFFFGSPAEARWDVPPVRWGDPVGSLPDLGDEKTFVSRDGEWEMTIKHESGGYHVEIAGMETYSYFPTHNTVHPYDGLGLVVWGPGGRRCEPLFMVSFGDIFEASGNACDLPFEGISLVVLPDVQGDLRVIMPFNEQFRYLYYKHLDAPEAGTIDRYGMTQIGKSGYSVDCQRDGCRLVPPKP